MRVLNEVKKPDGDRGVRERKRANISAPSAAEASKASDGSIERASINSLSPQKATRREPPIGGCLGGYPQGRARSNAGRVLERDVPVRAPTRAPLKNEASIKLETVVDQAAKLSRKEAQQLLDQLALRMRLTDEKRFNPDLESWADCVGSELNSRLSSDQAYGSMMVRAQLGEKENWLPIERFMKAAKLDTRTPAERKSFYMLLAELLVDHAKSEGRKHAHGLTLRNITRCCADIASIFDWNFPGYLESGLAYVVADQRQKIASGKTSV